MLIHFVSDKKLIRLYAFASGHEGIE